jgi:hypothetical protein
METAHQYSDAEAAISQVSQSVKFDGSQTRMFIASDDRSYLDP